MLEATVLQFYHYCLELEATRLKGGSTTADPSDFDTPLDAASAKTFLTGVRSAMQHSWQ